MADPLNDQAFLEVPDVARKCHTYLHRSVTMVYDSFQQTDQRLGAAPPLGLKAFYPMQSRPQQRAGPRASLFTQRLLWRAT